MNCVLNFYFVLFLVTIPVCEGSLYLPNDGIVLLENDTILPMLYDSPVAWFVEFYSSWCGHCQSFAPTWKKLAKSIEGWTEVIRVAALDCAEERNLNTCTNFNIQGYPTFKFFNAHITNTSDIGEFYLENRSPKKMRHVMIDFLESSKHNFEQIDFKPLAGSKLSDQYYIRKHKSKHIALVFESKASYLGRELFLDLMNCKKIVVKRVIDDNERQKKYNVTRLPQVVMLVHGKRYYVLNHTQEGILAELRSHHIKPKKLPTPKAIAATNSHFIKIHKNDTSTVGKVGWLTVYMQDLESALTSIFYQELVIKKTYGETRRKALIDFVDLLVKCFPAKPNVDNFLKSFRKWVKQRSAKSPINPEKLHQFYSKHKGDKSVELASEVNWQACGGRGYPCGLWLLFHTLTVNCEHRKPASMNGGDILARIRGFVTKFFGCIECGKHFYAMSKNVENEVHSFDEAILWLWRAHNKVNKRLSTEPSIFPHHPKIQYPPKFLCAECRANKTEWKDDVILEFLKVHYGANNILVAKSAEKAASDDKDLSESAYADIYLRHNIPCQTTSCTTTTTGQHTNTQRDQLTAGPFQHHHRKQHNQRTFHQVQKTSHTATHSGLHKL